MVLKCASFGFVKELADFSCEVSVLDRFSSDYVKLFHSKSEIFLKIKSGFDSLTTRHATSNRKIEYEKDNAGQDEGDGGNQVEEPAGLVDRLWSRWGKVPPYKVSNRACPHFHFQPCA